MIEITDLNHHIGGGPILTDISLTIPKGAITAIIGPNGAGKSTLVNLIAGQLPVQSGEITLDGSPLSQLPPKELALRLALVAQHVGIASRLRVADLIAFGRWPHNRGRPTNDDTDAIEQAISQFDLNDLRNRFLDELSGGQRQRAFVAMAFAQATEWLILDEPLNNLDMYHARTLMQKLENLCRNHGKSIVMIVHEVNYAAAWADRIVGLREGKIIIDGPTSATLTEDGIHRLFDMNVKTTDGQKPMINHYL